MALLSLMLVGVLLFPEQIGFVGILAGAGLLVTVIKQRWTYSGRYRNIVSRVAPYKRRSLLPVAAAISGQSKFKVRKFRASSFFRV